MCTPTTRATSVSLRAGRMSLGSTNKFADVRYLMMKEWHRVKRKCAVWQMYFSLSEQAVLATTVSERLSGFFC